MGREEGSFSALQAADRGGKYDPSLTVDVALRMGARQIIGQEMMLSGPQLRG